MLQTKCCMIPVRKQNIGILAEECVLYKMIGNWQYLPTYYLGKLHQSKTFNIEILESRTIIDIEILKNRTFNIEISTEGMCVIGEVMEW